MTVPLSTSRAKSLLVSGRSLWRECLSWGNVLQGQPPEPAKEQEPLDRSRTPDADKTSGTQVAPKRA